MDDLIILGIGRSLIELSIQKEELLQAVKQLKEKYEPKVPSEPKPSGSGI